MNSKKREFVGMILLGALLLVGLIALNGCKKSEPAASSESETEEVVAAAIEQAKCPVMGQAVNKEYFTEYKGKKVYFCCPGCKEKFEAEPEKYIAKLLQFSK